MAQKKKLTTKDKTILKMIIDELQTRQQQQIIVSNTTGPINDSGYYVTDTANDVYSDIFDKLSRDNDGDTRYDEETKELSIFFDNHWHRAKIDVITEAIRKKNLSMYELLEEMLEENAKGVI